MLLSEQEKRSAIGDSICELIQLTRAGSGDARERLMTQLRSYVALVASKNPARELQAKLGNSDLVQESMALAFENLEQFNGTNEAELFAWVKAILENEIRQARRAFRSEKRDVFRERSIDDRPPGENSSMQSPLQIADRDLTPGTFAVQSEDQQRVNAALDLLDEEYRQVIEYRNWDKLSFREIGRRMNRSENGATKLWFRALVALRKTMEQVDG